MSTFPITKNPMRPLSDFVVTTVKATQLDLLALQEMYARAYDAMKAQDMKQGNRRG